ncbi:ferritin-like domain-containing protein [Cohnella faecalis]|uniref:Ferritin-like domain-containing protein n=1 Tax=Cohnella faecalis TaxID=2315694 RepID=A0A398CNF7_9BACL|nr:ferritin-like domain-containing protein [Cohnella faecalis]RIE04896.1 ferritin-like domain-containing protein [Cohnella faecalis]
MYYVWYAPLYRNSIVSADSACLQTAIQLIAEAVGGEREDELFYQYLISIAPAKDEKEIIASIQADEKKHNRMFRSIYRELTGQEAVPKNEEPFVQPANYADGIRKALFGELRAVEKYRKIRECLPREGPYRDMLFEIITDELKHADKYNFLFTLNHV